MLSLVVPALGGLPVLLNPGPGLGVTIHGLFLPAQMDWRPPDGSGSAGSTARSGGPGRHEVVMGGLLPIVRFPLLDRVSLRRGQRTCRYRPRSLILDAGTA